MSAEQKRWPSDPTLAINLVPAASPDDPAVRFGRAGEKASVWITLFRELSTAHMAELLSTVHMVENDARHLAGVPVVRAALIPAIVADIGAAVRQRAAALCCFPAKDAEAAVCNEPRRVVVVGSHARR